jgi:hypothetical protein
MNRWTLVGLSLLTLGLLLPEARADLLPGRGVRPPRPIGQPGNPFVQPGGARPLPIKVKLVVKVDEKSKLPVLQVPINLALGQQGGPGGQALPPGGADAGRRLGMPTIVAGLALTLAFASGGLWLVRRGSGRALAIFLVLSLSAVGAAAVWANAAPPPPTPFGPRQPAPPPARPALPELKLPAGIELTDKLILEPVAAGDHLTLIVPKSMVAVKDSKEGKEKEPAPRERRIR